MDEVVTVIGYHRKAANRLVRRRLVQTGPKRRRGPPRVYGPGIAEVAMTLWEATGQIGARRLRPSLPELMNRLAACGELRISPDKRALV